MVDRYRTALRAMPPDARERYLIDNSRLPGPRANLELVVAAAEELTSSELRRYAGEDDEFLVMCGAVGLGRLLADGDRLAEDVLRQLAGDERWRVREGVAMALQRLGDADVTAMLDVAEDWARDASPYVRRAAVAGACEPRLIVDDAVASLVLALLDSVTGSIVGVPPAEARTGGFRALRKALGYCWSVAIAASPDEGFACFERWVTGDDTNVRWVVRQNLRKSRLRRADPGRVADLQDRVDL